MALVTKISFQSLIPTIFHPQARDMHVWSLLQIKPPPHQWNKDTKFKIFPCIRTYSTSTKPAVRLLWSSNNSLFLSFPNQVCTVRTINGRNLLIASTPTARLNEPYHGSFRSTCSTSQPHSVKWIKRALNET